MYFCCTLMNNSGTGVCNSLFHLFSLTISMSSSIVWTPIRISSSVYVSFIQSRLPVAQVQTIRRRAHIFSSIFHRLVEGLHMLSELLLPEKVMIVDHALKIARFNDSTGIFDGPIEVDPIQHKPKEVGGRSVQDKCIRILADDPLGVVFNGRSLKIGGIDECCIISTDNDRIDPSCFRVLNSVEERSRKCYFCLSFSYCLFSNEMNGGVPQCALGEPVPLFPSLTRFFHMGSPFFE